MEQMLLVVSLLFVVSLISSVRFAAVCSGVPKQHEIKNTADKNMMLNNKTPS